MGKLRHGGDVCVRRAKVLIGLPVVANDQGRVVGEVKDLCVDPAQRRVRALQIVDGAVWRRTRVLPWEQVVQISEDAVYIPAPTALSSGEELTADCWFLMASEGGVYGRSVIDVAGERLGRLGDILVDFSTGEIAGYEISDGMLQDLLSGRQRMLANSQLSYDGESLVIQACRIPTGEE